MLCSTTGTLRTAKDSSCHYVRLAQFVDPLPAPPVIRPHPESVTNISMSAFSRSCIAIFHPRRFGVMRESILDPRSKHDVAPRSGLTGRIILAPSTSYLSI
jgi:hypothetical protein